MRYLLLIIWITQYSVGLYSQEVQDLRNLENERKVNIEDTLDIELNALINVTPSLSELKVTFDSKYNNWRSGKVYTKTNNTLFGEIKNKIQHSGKTSIYLLYKEDAQSKKVRFRADKINGYEYDDRKYYPKRFSNLPPSYIELLDSGKLSLYYTKYFMIGGRYDPITETSYIGGKVTILELYIETENINNNELIGPIPLEQKRFCRFIVKYIQDYPALVEKVINQKYEPEIKSGHQ